MKKKRTISENLTPKEAKQSKARLVVEKFDKLFNQENIFKEKKSTIITSNKPLNKWHEIFGDAVLANAILDRLLHHSKVITINGPSYRTKDYFIEK